MGSHRVLLAAGSNARGQLGIGSCDDAHMFTPCQFADCEPHQLPDLGTSTIAQIACGANHTVVLLAHSEGTTSLWGTGDGRKGQLGPAGYRPEEPPGSSVPWTVFHRLALPPLPSGYACRHVAAAWETTYVVLSRPGSSDVLLSMGSDDFGALGTDRGGPGPKEPGSAGAGPWVVDFSHVFPDDGQPRTVCVRSLHAGPRHVVAQLVVARSDALSSHPQAALVGWGASRHGQLGQNGRTRFVPRPVLLPVNVHDDPMVSCGLGNQHTVVLHESGRISALGSNKQGQIPSFKARERICRLGCTWNGTYMQTTDGDNDILLSAGNNAQGQLGRDQAADRTTVNLPGEHSISGLACGSEHVLVATSYPSRGSDVVVGWGWNEHGNMGLGSLENIAIPTQLWPRETYRKFPQNVVGMWAGCATSWLLVE